jgi:hypothetical protein
MNTAENAQTTALKDRSSSSLQVPGAARSPAPVRAQHLLYLAPSISARINIRIDPETKVPVNKVSLVVPGGNHCLVRHYVYGIQYSTIFTQDKSGYLFAYLLAGN